jgi:protein-tyrosine phosphatase
MTGDVSTNYAIQFGLLSIAALVGAVFGVTVLAVRIVLGWAAVSLALERPRLLMKRDDGSQPVLAWLILWPYFLLARLSLLLYRLSHRGDVAVAEVLPGVWFARRLTAREMRELGVTWSAILDLAAEFPRVASNGTAYRALHMLDGAVPPEAQLRDAVAWIDEQARRGNVLVHCALGHGRTGSVILAWLLLHGHVPDVKTGVAHLRARRNTFGMSRAQAAFVDRLTGNWQAI